MTIREQNEQREHAVLEPWATFADSSAGRLRPMEPCPYRTCFQRDRDRIIHSKAFRRLGNKTQVFISPEGDHYRARLTHTLEVAQIARTIARALGLNEDLTEAIALVVDVLEDLNLTREVRNGIVCHTGRRKASTPEGRIIHFADRIAYINHDIDDAVRAGIIRENDIPQHLRKRLGETHGKRIDTLVTAMIEYGQRYLEIGMDEQMHADMMELRQFMFDHVYHGTAAQREEKRAKSMLRSLYEYFIEHPDELPDDYFVLQARGEALERIACDYVAGMTDRYSIAVYKNLFIPKSWNKIED